MTVRRWIFEAIAYFLALGVLFLFLDIYQFGEIFFVVFLVIFFRTLIPFLVTIGFVWGPLNFLHENLKNDPVGKTFLIGGRD